MPTPIQQRRPKHSIELVNLDEAEMTMKLAELDLTAEVEAVMPLSAYDWLSELNSAASMIMDREEREALAKELASMHLQHPVAA
jgi:hypothetical protein